jgi:serine/threonine-protein kinase HipA
MADLAREVVDRSIAVPGVQPKLSMSLVKDSLTNRSVERLTIVGALGGQFIFKPPSQNFREMPENEHLTMRMAEAFGIRTVSSSLIRLASGELSYITRRIDRHPDGSRIHMLDMFQVTEAADKYKSSMEKVGKALGQWSENVLLDKLLFFELTVFCFLTGNNDMHLKNFSMILLQDTWQLAPAYDLLNVAIVNPADQEELALTLEGRKRKLQRINFERFGKNLGLNDRQINGVFNRINAKYLTAVEWINRSFLSVELQSAYLSLIDKRYEILNTK